MSFQTGDVFTINLNDDEIGFGQVVAIPSRSNLIVCIFDKKNQKTCQNIDLQDVCSSPIILMGYTLDAKFYHKHWQIIGNYLENLKTIVLPYNRMGTPPDDIYITNYQGKRIRQASINEFEKLNYQTVIAPVRYENALKAYYGYMPWIEEDYNKLLYSNYLAAKQVVERE